MYFDSFLYTLLLCVPVSIGLYFKKNNKLNSDIICILLLFTGAILRMTYISYTDLFTRQHDVFYFFKHSGGHGEYITYLYKFRHLPDFDPRSIYQFYHPPLHHIICALFLTLIEKMGFSAKTTGVELLPILTATYSCLFTIFAYKMLKLFNLKSKTLQLCTAFVTFHPTLIIMSGSLNNDMLSSLFGMMAMYFTVKWAKTRNPADIIGIALSVGLGMFTKLTVGLLAPAIAAVFLYVFVKHKETRLKLFFQYVIFGIICVPIGLYWPVRNYTKYEVPFTYVPKFSETDVQFIDKTPFERLFNWLPYQFASPFTQWPWNAAPYKEFNPIIALWKNQVFDEETFFGKSITMQSFCTALFFCGIAVSLYSAAALVVLWFKKKTVRHSFKLFLTIVPLVVFGNYIIFCLNYPFICTQNMRYCVPLIPVGAVLLGMYIDHAKHTKNRKYKNSVVILQNIMKLFCGLSVFIYTALKYYYVKN